MQPAGNASDQGQRSIAVMHRSSRADVTNARFEQEFFGELKTLFSAEAAAVWFLPGGETLYLRHQNNLPTDELQRNMEDWQGHGRLLMATAQSGEARSVHPEWSNEKTGNPTSYELLIAPAVVYGSQIVLLEIFRTPGSRSPSLSEAAELSLLSRAAEFAADRTRMGQLANAARDRIQWKNRDGFIQKVHGTLDPERIAYVAANDGRDTLSCDRVSIALRQGGQARIAAVSGQPKVDRRANQVRLLESLVTAVMKGTEAVVVGPNTRQCPPQVTDWLTAYLADAKPSTLFIVPMQPAPNSPAFGAFIVEQFDTKLSPESLVEGVNQLSGHTSVAIRNAIDHDRIFLGSLRGNVGKFFAETMRLRTLLALAVIAAVTVGLIFIPWELRLEGRGALRADHRKGVFAPEDGVVRDLKIRHGDRVEEGQVLAVLENSELSVMLQQAREQLVSAEETLKIRETQMSERSLRAAERLELDGEIAQLQERVSHLQRQVALLENRIAPLTIRAPMSGIIATWQPDRQLLNRPVMAGNLLLNVIDEQGPWAMELEVPEDDAGYIMEAWNNRRRGQRLPVDYLLASNPEKRYRGWLSDVAPRTESLGDKHVVLMTVVPDPQDLPPLRDGTEVRGKVHCGERSMGYVFLREMIEFFHARIAFLF